MHAATVPGRFRRRWTVETRFRTQKSGTRIKHRRLDSVAGWTVLARERPDTPATGAFPEAEVDLFHAAPESRGRRDVARMPARRVPDIWAVVIGLGRLVGSHPSRRRPLPGTKKVGIRTAEPGDPGTWRHPREMEGLASPIQARAAQRSAAGNRSSGRRTNGSLQSAPSYPEAAEWHSTATSVFLSQDREHVSKQRVTKSRAPKHDTGLKGPGAEIDR